MNYFQWAENRAKKPPFAKATPEERAMIDAAVVDIPDILVTEETLPGWYLPVTTYPRHEWQCPCIECRIDRCEEASY